MPRPKKAPPKRAHEDEERIPGILQALDELYPEAHCELNFETPFQLLVATILSAQCTDKRVNMVTPTLFSRFPDAAAMSQAKWTLIGHQIIWPGRRVCDARKPNCGGCSLQPYCPSAGKF